MYGNISIATDARMLYTGFMKFISWLKSTHGQDAEIRVVPLDFRALLCLCWNIRAGKAPWDSLPHNLWALNAAKTPYCLSLDFYTNAGRPQLKLFRISPYRMMHISNIRVAGYTRGYSPEPNASKLEVANPVDQYDSVNDETIQRIDSALSYFPSFKNLLLGLASRSFFPPFISRVRILVKKEGVGAILNRVTQGIKQARIEPDRVLRMQLLLGAARTIGVLVGNKLDEGQGKELAEARLLLYGSQDLFANKRFLKRFNTILEMTAIGCENRQVQPCRSQ